MLRCRVCLQSEASGKDTVAGYMDFLQLLSDEDDSEQLSCLECFNECTRLNVTPEEAANCNICMACKDELKQAYRFIARARLSDEILKGEATFIDSGGDSEYEREIDFIEPLYDDNLESELSKNEAVILDDKQQEQLERELSEIFGQETQELITTIDVDKQALIKCKENNVEEYAYIDAADEEEVKEDKGTADYADDDENDATSILVKLVNAESEDENYDSVAEEEDEQKNFFVFNCEFCTDTFYYQRDLMQHYEKDHDDKNLNFACDLCENRFVTKNVLRIHKRQIHELCEYIDCQLCGRTVLKSFYNIHLKRHNHKVKYLCSQCPNTFTSKYSLTKHMRQHAEKRDRNVKCAECGRKFYSSVDLQHHLATHRDPDARERYTCTVCAKEFVRQPNLRLHMKMHRGETIDCMYCGKKFVRRKDMEVHIRFHTGEFPFSCSVCGKKFATKSHVIYHEKKHRGVRYSCNCCEKSFKNISGLKEHAFEHTGMPLICNVCNRGFPTKFKMRRHLRTVHIDLFESGYTDVLAEQHITEIDVPKLALKQQLIKYETDNICMDTVEMLEEHENDIAVDMLRAT